MNIALQLWTVRALADEDLLAALDTVAAIGYRAVEFAGFGGLPPHTIRRRLDALGLAATGAHLALDDLALRLPQTIEALTTIGAANAVLASIVPDQRATPEQVEHLAERLNTIGDRLRAAGLRLVYHNEDYDFAPLGRSTLWHTIVERSDPALLSAQLDIVTAVQQGVDPLALLASHGARISSIHCSEYAAGAYLPIGSGTTDWLQLIHAARAAGVEWLIVEHDALAEPLAGAAASLAALTAAAAH